MKGHIAPHCPNKNSGSNQGNTNNRFISKQDKGERRCNSVVVEEHPHVYEGTINGQEISVVLDSGACISIVPKSSVKDSQFINETVTIVVCTKDKYVANIAVVPFQFVDWEMTKEVAIAPDEMLSGCALYSFKLLDESDMKFIEFIKAKKDAIAKETANTPTLIVTTTAQDRAEREEQEQTDK